MGEIRIRAEQLAKKYYIGRKHEKFPTLRDAIANVVSAPFRRAGRLLRGEAASEMDEEIWALRDASFEIKEGELVGIIGRNGAGKSTLLKLLSRITGPTSGYAEIRGRVGSLLEVGTGFHPELTGRENIYLNGSILGMKSAEISRKFDGIVDFAEVEKFIDTPVKHYSSGMYLRLAFAVAAHLDPEILLVDEVLAVGDARFQKKCLNKMEDVGKQGRTVLFVSHNMPAITRLCERTILLDDGKVVKDGPAYAVVSSYMNTGNGTMAAREWDDISRSPGNEIARLCAVRVRAEDGLITDTMDIRRPVSIEIEYEVLRSGHTLLPNLHFINQDGLEVFVIIDLDPEWRKRKRPAGRYVSRAWIPGNLLAEGTLYVRANLCTLDPQVILFDVPEAVAFHAVDSHNGDSARGDFVGHFPGVIRPVARWETQYTPPDEGIAVLK